MTEPERRKRAQRLARAALELYEIDDATVELLRHEFVQVFRVCSAAQGEFALRLYGLPEAIGTPDHETPERGPTGAEPGRRCGAALRSPDVLRSQLLWLSALRRDSALLVPEPVPTLEGELVGEVAVADTPSRTPWRRRCALVRWVPGVQKGEDLTEAVILRAGSVLARMHDHAEGYGVPEGSKFPRWDWHWPFGEGALLWSKGPEFYSAEEMEVFGEAAWRIRERLEEMGEGRDFFGLIHRDLNPRNIVFSGEGVGVIDFDLCGLGFYLFDLSVFRRSLEALPEDRRGALWEAFLRGYENVRPLPESIHARLDRHLLTFGVMQRVTAINRRLELLKGEAAEHHEEAQRKWRRFLRTSQTWLRRRVQHLAVLPCGLDGLPYTLCELLVI